MSTPRPTPTGPSQAPRPLVTVIIPAYNAAAFIRPTIESVLSQTFTDFEFLVVDDGSTDGTRDVVTSYGERLRYLWKPNGGQSSSRNLGILHARAKYVAFLDHDDIWLPEKLAIQVRAMEAAPEAGLVTCGSVHFDASGDLRTEIPQRLAMTRSERLGKLLVGNLIGSCSKVLVRKNCFDTLGSFDEELRMGEDWEMWFRIALHHEILALPDLLVRYRIHPGNFSAASGRLNLENELVFLRRAFAEPSFRPAPLLRRRATAERYFAAAIAFRESNERREMLGALGRAVVLWPQIACRKASIGVLLAALRSPPDASQAPA